MLLCLFSCVLFLFTSTVFGQSERARSRNLNRGALIRLEDAKPKYVHVTNIEELLRYERTEEKEDRFVFETNINHGFSENSLYRVFVPIFLGNALNTGSGDVGLSLLQKRSIHPEDFLN